MKKLIIATAVVAFFTACTSTTESDIQESDSTIVKSVDSIKVVDSLKK